MKFETGIWDYSSDQIFFYLIFWRKSPKLIVRFFVVGIVWDKINFIFWLIMLISTGFIFLGWNFTHGALNSNIFKFKEKKIITTKINNLSLYLGQWLKKISKLQSLKNSWKMFSWISKFFRFFSTGFSKYLDSNYVFCFLQWYMIPFHIF
jgi:hypothetical protein